MYDQRGAGFDNRKENLGPPQGFDERRKGDRRQGDTSLIDRIPAGLAEQVDDVYDQASGYPTPMDDEVVSLSVTPPTELPATSKEAKRKPNWFRRHLLGLSMGAMAASAALGLTVHPDGHVINQVEANAPWVGAGVAGSEILWVGGAQLMLAAAGKEIGIRKILKIKSRMTEIKENTVDSGLFRAGLAINTVGAVGTAGFVAGGIASGLPKESWSLLAIPAIDLAQTIGIRAAIYKSMKDVTAARALEARASAETSKQPKVNVRRVTLSDMEALAEIDLARFKKAYGKAMPTKAEVIDMMTQRFSNSPDTMFLCELNGRVEGFISTFATNVPIEEFVSWEHTTANGTLKDCVVPGGKYDYVVNLTVNPGAAKLGATEMLIAFAFADAIRNGMEYGYFTSRMPSFKSWVERKQKIDTKLLSQGMLNELAQNYFALKRQKGDKEVRQDYELRMYEEFGFELVDVVPNAFEDEASLNFGVTCKVQVPPKNKFLHNSRIFRKTLANSLQVVAKHPKLLKKVL